MAYSSQENISYCTYTPADLSRQSLDASFLLSLPEMGERRRNRRTARLHVGCYFGDLLRLTNRPCK